MARRAEAGEATITIGALSRASGVPVPTIRTWEARYGYPRAERKASGHRVYPLDAVERLRRVAQALARGVRAAEVVPASDAELDRLLSKVGGPLAVPSGVATGDVFSAIIGFDRDRLTRILLAEATRLGPLAFVAATVGPLARQVGEAWASGRIDIGHEHFFSERVGDVLRTLRLGWEERASGAVVALSSLPGESHVLGLQMAALVLAVAGRRVVYFGAEIPIADLPELARATRAKAVGISASIATRGARTNRTLGRLVELLPRSVELLVGGEGAPATLPGARVIRNLDDLYRWAR